MSADDISEALDGLRTAVLADATFAAMLATTSSIYLSPPQFKVSSPLIEWIWGNLSPQLLTSPGVYRPTLTMNVFAVTPQLCFGIVGYLEANWSIPLTKPAGVLTTNFAITELLIKSPVYVGPRQLLNTNEQVHQVAVECSLRINKR